VPGDVAHTRIRIRVGRVRLPAGRTDPAGVADLVARPRSAADCARRRGGRVVHRSSPADRRSRLTAGDSAAAARRRAAAERFRPDRIDTLLVAEAPPSAPDRYFYFDFVPTHDSLFRHVVQGVLGERPTRDKLPFLEELRERGVFLVELCEEPFGSRRAALPRCVPGLVRRCLELAPRRIILVAVGCYDHAFEPLRQAGLPVIDARLPYPGSGQQRRFLEGFALALHADPPDRLR
jgi:hypothetical protein